MEHIGEILRRYQGTNPQGFLTTSNNQLRIERLKVNCAKCGKEFEQVKTFGRDGKPYGLPYGSCADCRAKEQTELAIKRAEDSLPRYVTEQKAKWRKECPLPPIFEQSSFENFNVTFQPKAHYVASKFDGKSIVLCSPELYGVGKTHLACALASHLIEHTVAVDITDNGTLAMYRCPVYFTTEMKLLSRIRDTYSRSSDVGAETEEIIFGKLSKYQVLIIDDVGKVRPKDYSFLQGVYFRIIDERYNSQQTIVLTTNLSLKDLEAHIGGACADRLKEMCGKENIVVMTGRSYRGTKPDAK